MFNKKNNNKGFTLMEMLIVVAIIAILIAIAIPTFSSTLEKARESTDAANIRAAYSEAASKAVTSNSVNGETATVVIAQNDPSKWDNDQLKDTVIGAKYDTGTKGASATDKVTLSDAAIAGCSKGDTLIVTVYADGSVSLAKKGASSGSGSGK